MSKGGARGKVAGPIASLRALSAALAGIGTRRSHVALARIVKDGRWGFGRAAPWRVEELPAMARWIDGNLQEDRGGEVIDDEEGGSPVAAGVDLYDVDGLVRKHDLGKANTIAKLKVTIERAANLTVDRLIKEREYIKREEADEANAKKIEAIKRAHQELPRSLRQVLADTSDPAKVEDILASALRTIFNEAFGGK